MHVYANNITIALSDNKSECMISFRQIQPHFNEQGIVQGNRVESVAEVVMSREGISALKSILSELDLNE